MDLDLGNIVIWVINTSIKTLESVVKLYKYMQKSKTQHVTKPDTKIMKNQIEKGFNRASD